MSVAIISLIIAIPILSAIVWQKRARALWSSLFFGLGAYAVINLLRIPLGQVLANPSVQELIAFPDLGIVMKVPVAWILFAFALALFREGIRWLLLFFPATSVRTWKEGVMFGLGYSCPAAMNDFGRYVAHYAKEIEAYPYSFVAAVKFMNGMLEPLHALIFALDSGIAETIFNVGTCLVVMSSVLRRNVWLFLAAVLWYVSFSQLPKILFFNLPELENGYLYWLLSLFSPTLTKTIVALLPFLLLVKLRMNPGIVQN